MHPSRRSLFTVASLTAKQRARVLALSAGVGFRDLMFE